MAGDTLVPAMAGTAEHSSPSVSTAANSTQIIERLPVRTRLELAATVDAMTDAQPPEQQPSFRHFSTMPLWAKLALIAAVIAVGIAVAAVS